MRIVDWLDVGTVSAERDPNLSDYFFDNGVLEEVIQNPSAFLVLGRKGAGKTALFKHLEANPRSYIGDADLLVPLSFEDYNWNVHALLANREVAESQAYKQSWRFVILVEVVKALIAQVARTGGKPPSQLAHAGKLLERLFSSPVPSIYDIVGRKLLSLAKIRLPKAGLDLESGDLDSIEVSGGAVEFDTIAKDATLKSQLSQSIENIITYLHDAASAVLTSDQRVFVCFDRVDEAWDTVSVDSSRPVIAGLVAAADSVVGTYSGRIRPIVFLREDIFETLALNDANKLREDCGALLHWTRESLFRMLLSRVNFAATRAGCDAVEDLDDLFDKREMRQRAKPTNYILKRTMMRPRDLICFTRRIVEAQRDVLDDPFGEAIFSTDEKLVTDIVYDAEVGYSDWLVKELHDEWGVQYPEIRGLIEIIQNSGSTNISQSVLYAGIVKVTGEPSLAAQQKHAAFLFENSVLGFKVGGSANWRFKCFYPSQGFVEAGEFHVHDGLTKALKLKEPRDPPEDPECS